MPYTHSTAAPRRSLYSSMPGLMSTLTSPFAISAYIIIAYMAVPGLKPTDASRATPAECR